MCNEESSLIFEWRASCRFLIERDVVVVPEITFLTVQQFHRTTLLRFCLSCSEEELSVVFRKARSWTLSSEPDPHTLNH